MTSLQVEDLSVVCLVAVLHAFQIATNAAMVGAARRKHKIEPPEMNGPPEFLRTVRVQQNDLEFAVPFQVVLWCSGIFCHQAPAAALGLMYIYGRRQYRKGYIEDAKKRVKGFHISVHAIKGLLASCVLGLANIWMKKYFDINVPALVLEKYYGTK